ncbi:unnamed protein product [Calypogeia fissa]
MERMLSMPVRKICLHSSLVSRVSLGSSAAAMGFAYRCPLGFSSGVWTSSKQQQDDGRFTNMIMTQGLAAQCQGLGIVRFGKSSSHINGGKILHSGRVRVSTFVAFANLSSPSSSAQSSRSSTSIGSGGGGGGEHGAASQVEPAAGTLRKGKMVRDGQPLFEDFLQQGPSPALVNSVATNVPYLSEAETESTVKKGRIAAVVQTTEPELTEEEPVEVETPDQGAAWKGFVERVSGEWDGYGAEFNFLGEPSELPSQVVPDAFRDWGVEVYDWQTMCPTLGQEEEPGNLAYKVIRLLPTVGCEADAATAYCSEERDFGTALAYAFHANGSYNAVWPGKGVVRNNPDAGRTGKIVVRNTDNSNEWEVEHCLVKKGGSSRNRTRILQQFRVDDDTKVPQLKNITVYVEQWDGPFRNGESLGGCSTSGSGFATTEILEHRSLTGSWKAESFLAEGETSPRLTFEGSGDVERSQAEEIVALPMNLWSSVKASEGATSYSIEAGWLLNPGQIMVSSVEYLPSGNFQASRIKFEQRR